MKQEVFAVWREFVETDNAPVLYSFWSSREEAEKEVKRLNENYIEGNKRDYFINDSLFLDNKSDYPL